MEMNPENELVKATGQGQFNLMRTAFDFSNKCYESFKLNVEFLFSHLLQKCYESFALNVEILFSQLFKKCYERFKTQS